MNWNDVWKIALTIITSVGGIGSVILLVIKFSANQIAKRLETKYSLKMNKELEEYKHTLDGKTYISKMKFDTEYEIYRSLSKSFFDMVKSINILIPSGMTKVPIFDTDEEKREYEKKLYQESLKTAVIAQDSCSSSIPFISAEFECKYREILNLCFEQIDKYSERWSMSILAPYSEKSKLNLEDYKKTDLINQKFKELNKNLRDYISQLDVIA